MEDTTRRLPPAGLGELVRMARMRRGWRLREAARVLHLDPGYWCRIETGARCPSRWTAERLADGLHMTQAERQVLLAAALDDAGRSHPRAQARRERRQANQLRHREGEPDAA